MKHLFTLTLIAVFSIMNICTAQTPLSFEGTDAYGRLDDITFDPTTENKLYAVTLGNHILVSNDKGETWDILFSFPENEVYLKNLRYLNGHQLSFYVDYSEQNNGIYIYDLNSNSIVKEFILPIPPDSDKEWVMFYDLQENNTDVLIAYQGYRVGFAGFGKVYYTNDGGSNWNEIYFTENYDGVFPNSVAVSPNNAVKVFIMRDIGPDYNAGGIMISEDAGATWSTELIGSSFYALTFHPQDPENILAGTYVGHDENHQQELYHSLDGGASWTASNLSWTDDIMNNINKIVYNPNDLNHLLLLEENEVLISYDGASNWTNYVYPTEDPTIYYYGLNASFNPFASNEVFINANYHPMFSTDGGESMSRHYNRFYHSTLVSIFENETEKHLYHSVQQGIVHTNINTGEEQHYDIVPIFIFSNEGIPFYKADSNIPGRLYSFRGGFSGSNLYVSDDHGQTTESIYQIFFDNLVQLTADPNDTHKVWVSFFESGVKILDFSDMLNVVETEVVLPETGLIYAIHIDESNSEHVLISVNNKVYESTNGGTSWVDISNGLSLSSEDMIFDLQRNPNNPEMYLLAAQSGIYKTTDGGQNWEQVHSDFNVRKLKFSQHTDGHVIAGVPTSSYNSSKVLYSGDNGDTWTTITTDMFANTGTYSMDFSFEEESVEVYMATLDLGLVKFSIDLSTLSGPEFENAATGKLRIYPNPAHQLITVDLAGETIQQVEVYTSSGTRVLQHKAQTTIALDSLSGGVYFVKVTSQSGTVFVKKIIKK